jgi:hemolysin activation/secretion protein
VRWGGWTLGLLAFLCAGTTGALAQAIPPSVQPGAIERQTHSGPQVLPSGKIELPAPETLSAPENGAAIKAHFTAIDVVGATALSPAELAPAYRQLIGRDATIADLYAAAKAITAKYVAAGYAISFAIVPQQTIEDGHAEIDVVEGYVAEYRFDGDTGNIPQVLIDYADHIVSSRPLKTAALERFLLLANCVPGYTVKGVFDRMDNAPRGATRLIIRLEHKVATAYATVDNRGSKAMGPWRIDLGATFNNLFGHGDALSLRGFVSSDTRELRYGSVTTSWPLNGNGTRLVVEGTYSDGRPGLWLLRLLDFASNGKTVRLGVEHPLIRSRAENLQLDFYVAGQWLSSNISIYPNSRDRIYSLSAGGTYWRNDDEGMTTLSAHITQGLNVFDATTTDSLLRSRYAGSGVNTTLNLSAARLQELGNGFQGALSVSGQLATGPLLVSQECGYGGGVFGRGFDDSEMVGDVCVLGSAELRYNTDLCRELMLEMLQFYGFADVGYVDSRGSLLPGELRSETAYSVGVGFRWRLNENLSGWLEYAQPVSHDVAQLGNRHGRLFVSLTGEF